VARAGAARGLGAGAGTVALALRAFAGRARARGREPPAVGRAARLLAPGRSGRQRRARGERVLFDVVRVVARAHPGQRIERQPVAHGRVTRHEVHALVAEEPGPGGPHRATQRGVARVGLQRQHIAHHRVQALVEHAAQPHPLEFVGQLAVERVHVHRQAALAPQVVPGVLVAGGDVARGDAQPARQRLREAARVVAGVVGLVAFVGQQRGVVPAGLAIGAPEHRERPARQLFARVPLALAHVHEAARAVLRAQPVEQFGGVAALGRAERVGVPFGGVAVAGGHVGGLATLGQAHVVPHQVGVDLLAQRQHRGPLVVGVGLGHARRFVDARDLHVVLELHLGLVHQAFHRRGAARLRGAGQRNVAFAREQARGRVEADPARAGQEHLAPRVQVGEVLGRAARAVDGLHVGRELDQVARHEARGQAQVAQQLHQQPAAVAARTALELQGLLGRLHPGLHADGVADVLLHALVQVHQEIHRALRRAVDAVEVGLEQRRQRFGGEVGREFGALCVGIGKGHLLGVRLEEEVERVVHRHLDHQVHRDLELGGGLGEHQPRLVVGERVLLPVDEVVGRLDALRIREHLGACVRCGAQAHHLRTEPHQAVVAVVGDVAQGNVDGHASGTFCEGTGVGRARRTAVGHASKSCATTP